MNVVDSALRRDLLGKLGVSHQALSKRAKRIKREYGPMSTDEAVYVIAHLEGLDLSRYLSLEMVDRVRSLVPRTTSLPAVRKRTMRAAVKGKSSKERPYPLVARNLIESALRMGSEVYPQMFALENSIRGLIRKRLDRVGSNWWDRLAPDDVKGNVARTIAKEKRYTYRRPRGDHPLLYANFDDLKKIILRNASHFSDIINDMDWFKVKMDETYMARNNLAHCVPLPRGDDSRIGLFVRDWENMLRRAGES